jgi:hypothetical protein
MTMIVSPMERRRELLPETRCLLNTKAQTAPNEQESIAKKAQGLLNARYAMRACE